MLRLLAALVVFGLGSLWARRTAVAHFRRRLRCQGLPAELVAALAEQYRDAFRLSDLLAGARRPRR